MTAPRKDPDVTYDASVRRYRATCPHCGYVAVRADRNAALWVLSNHVAYQHGAPA